MADTMTLEQVRDWHCRFAETHNEDDTNTFHTKMADAIDAAIRELDRLRGDCARLVDCINAQPPTRRSLIDRAERAGAELAALKARIAGAPLVEIANIGDPFIVLPDHFTVPNSLKGKRVRLVVEE